MEAAEAAEEEDIDPVKEKRGTKSPADMELLKRYYEDYGMNGIYPLYSVIQQRLALNYQY